MTGSGLFVAYDPAYVQPLPPDHRFPMIKYELLAEQLVYEGLVQSGHFHTPGRCLTEIAGLTHTQEYQHKLLHQQLTPREQRVIGFPQSPALTHREYVITQGTIDCCLHALHGGVALNIAGGTHHAFADHGEGFCLLNDFAVAANYLLHAGVAKKVLIIDLDVHQGNGTASIFSNNPDVFTFSMHGGNNYPFHKENSDVDIPLEDGISDTAYLGILHEALPPVIAAFQPDFAFYLSGVDILATDRFGKLKVTAAGCSARDRFVFSALKTAGIPVTVAMGGGYSPHVRDIVNAHCQTFREAARIFGK
ncbi:histone deacetylase family protein [Flavihumibacter petaseus]|uniref:Histone deacetylase family protein n=1 Tax=Flavihumibacter petaseus NBRC 106054 TaxID=1220578 RepID=A0A0E9MTZ7_9BACT|nr:histone deacetylase [Flavihumibacter petaseus]GAO41252.1 histone deacetylase family protein [Flavihumibacter petaseus NBRC 106054]